jgi:ubiquinone/menaquinone biosynthesis C-methylase UbiE
MEQTDKIFSGSIASIYDRYLVPLIFAPYASDLAARVRVLAPKRVLETAAGTGVVTGQLIEALGPAASITATDLNQAMLDVASARLSGARIAWKACDATSLPFSAGEFDAVVCQFGAMFFPDKLAGYREARRVLRPGGKFFFNVWDRVEFSPLTHTVSDAVAAAFPDDPPNFLARTPHGYNDIEAIRSSLMEAGFSKVVADIVKLPARAPRAVDVATGFCQGSPLRNEIEKRDAGRLAEVTEAATKLIAARFGVGPIDSTMQAIVFSATA